jgi:hypothetical protein
VCTHERRAHARFTPFEAAAAGPHAINPKT